MKKLKYIIGGCILFSFILGTYIMWKTGSDITELLPAAVDGWKTSEKDQIYNSDNLYTYIDGGAELYISYGFKEVISRTYAKHDQPDILVDIFDMGTSHNAFGVFSHSRETIDATFGQGSQYTHGQLLFWKDHYFISILASPETAESKKAVFNIAGTIEDAVKGEGPLPGILTYLPQQALIKESVRYFHHYIWLNSYFFLSDRNILHINEHTDVVLAKYGEQKNKHILLLVKYINNEDAKTAYNEFITSYVPALSEKREVQVRDGTWTACQLTDTLIIIVFKAPLKDTAVQLIKNVKTIFYREHAP